MDTVGKQVKEKQGARSKLDLKQTERGKNKRREKEKKKSNENYQKETENENWVKGGGTERQTRTENRYKWRKGGRGKER